MILLSVKDLVINVSDGFSRRELIKGIHFDVDEQGIVALVGGSGCGKTTAALSILGLLPSSMSIEAGSINFLGKELTQLNDKQMRGIRGKEISMIFQEPLSAFNPVFTVGYQIGEMLKAHTKLNSSQIKKKMLHLMDIVGLTDPKRAAQSYPHHLSGGMRQRAMIAQAIAVDPKLIIADEPTSNLDVTLQAHIIELFKELRKSLNIAMILITHDLGVVRELADEVVILFDGRVVEAGTAQKILTEPHHAFTCELVKTLKE